MEKGFYTLNIDEEFRSMIHPLRREEYNQLEVNLVIDGCLNPIITWHGIIVDGHNRYEICNRLKIPYAVQELYLETREDVIIWICTNQLGRRNIAEETRKYLIGRKYESEKLLIKNKVGINQYMSGDKKSAARKESGRRTAQRIGQEYKISSSLVQKYYEYSKAIDEVSRKDPEIKPKILSGNIKISHENLITLSQKEAEDVKAINQKLSDAQNRYVRYKESRKILTEEPPVTVPEPAIPAIKQMPRYDPDADTTGLTLTIPSWISSIERVKNKINLEDVSDNAKENLKKSLYELQTSIDGMLTDIKEKGK